MPTTIPEASTYVRTNGGNRVHLRTCRYSVNGSPWNWAEGRGVPELQPLQGVYGWRLCKVCLPWR